MIQHVVPQREQQHEHEVDEFVNEIMFQFKIRHNNVVKLIGCCLETHIPILVFELVSTEAYMTHFMVPSSRILFHFYSA